MPQFNFLRSIYTNFSLYSEMNAFFIKGRHYTYGDLSRKVSRIQQALMNDYPDERYVGVVLNDDLWTYASILALWFSGYAFVPVNPLFPPERNRSIISQVRLKLLLHSSLKGIPEPVYASLNTINTSELSEAGQDLPAWKDPDPKNDLYVLFTSGSTGVPKGVRISMANLNHYIRDFIQYPSYSFSADDRFLQIYDLSFDVSIRCYVVPLVMGACVYTVPQDEIKYLAAYKIMLEQKLTFAAMPPSTLYYLRPYFPSIRLPDLKYSLLGGEPFSAELAAEWEPCVPQAIIQNIYGPTEVTINCLIYDWNGPRGTRKAHNGTVSIGKPFGTNLALVLNDRLEPVKPFETGELLMGGGQVSSGFWSNDALDRKAFAGMDYMGKKIRFYRTGDLVTMDGEGDIMFLNRRDEQIQVQGYRVEPGEIEQLARKHLNGMNVVVMGKESRPGEMKLYLLAEGEQIDQKSLMQFLSERLPHYMKPAKVIVLSEFPRLVSGKLDRRALYQTIPDE